jgi:hypothetical protein
MLKLYSRILVIFSFLNTNTVFIQAGDQAACAAASASEDATNTSLFQWFQKLDPQNSDLIDLIQAHFETDNPEVINFIVELTDHINLAVSVFRKHFTKNEIQQILDFHTSDVGQKFGAVFPTVMHDYKEALDDKLIAIKTAIIAQAKTQQNQPN